MGDLFVRVWVNLIHRVHGPLTFRLVLQPLTAAALAARAGLRDVREGRPAYAWALFRRGVERGALLREGWREVARVFVFAVAVDLVYEAVVFRRFYPGEAVIVAAILALLPYPLIRSAVNLVLRQFVIHHVSGVRDGVRSR